MLFILYWFLIAPLASSLAVDAPNASRSLVFLPTWYIFEAIGILSVLSFKKHIQNGMIIMIFVFYLINYFYYAHNYFMHTNNIYGIYWQSGYKEAIVKASQYEKNGSRVFFDPSFEQAYIFYLFYNQYDPAKYIASGGSDRIKNKCFNIDNAFFGECRGELKKGDIVMSIKEEKTNKLRKIGTLNGQDNEAIYEAL